MKRIVQSFSLFVLTILCVPVWGISVSGKHASLKGKQVSIGFIENDLLRTKMEVARVKADAQGAFSFTLKVEDHAVCYVELGHYEGLLFVESGEEYSLNLQALEAKILAASGKFLYEPVKILLPLNEANSKLLHAQLLSFELDYQFYEDQIILNLEEDFLEKVIRAAQKELKVKYGAYEQAYFKQYMNCKLALLELFEPRNRGVVVSEYLNHYKVSSSCNPAFGELMDQMWSNHLSALPAYYQEYYGEAIRRRDYTALSYIFRKHVGAEDMGWVPYAIAQMIYGQKYLHIYVRKDMVALLQVMKSKEAGDENLGLTIAKLVEDLSQMMPGAPFPVKEIEAFDGGKVLLDSYLGKVVVLYFFNTKVSNTQETLKQLRVIKQRMEGKMEVVAVLSNEDKEEFEKIADQYLYDFEVAYWNDDKSLLSRFEVKDFPVIHVYDAAGKLYMANAPGVEAGLEVLLKTIARNSSGAIRRLAQ